MDMKVVEVLEKLGEVFPDYHIAWNGYNRSILINYRDVEFSITKENDKGKSCYCIKKYDRTLEFNPYICEFRDTIDEVIKFLKRYTDIYKQMYLKLDELEVTQEESSYKKGETDAVYRNSNACS